MNQVGAGRTATSSLGRQPHSSLNHFSTSIFLIFVVVFIVYGSLFPFDFRDKPEAFDKLVASSNFFSNPADAIENLLLFVPLGFALYARFPRLRDRLIAFLLATLFLGFGIQVIQLYLPSRTASFSDVFWNDIGLLAGLLTAGAARKWLDNQLAEYIRANPFPLLLVLLWFFYESFPFVPTLDYGLLRDHIKTAVFAPPFEWSRFVQHLLAAMLAGIALQHTHSSGKRGLATVAAGVLVVLLEIFVAYGSLRRETLLGMTIGLAGGYSISKCGEKPALTTLSTIAAGVYLLTIFTPYRGQIADAGFTITPFSNFLWLNVTRDLPPLAFEALAIGTLLWVGFFKPSWFRRNPALWVSIVLLAISALEAIRVLAVGFHGDTTTLLIAAVLGSFSATYRNNPMAAMARHSVPPPVTYENRHHHDRPTWTTGKVHAMSIALLAMAIYSASHVPGMPYNILELFPSGTGGIIAALSLSATIYLAANSTFFLLMGKTRRRLVLFPLLLPLQGIIIWILLRIGVPLESIHDIVGAPVLDWPREWEMFLRFLALHQSIATQMIGAVLIVTTICRPSLFAVFAYWLVVSLMFAWPLHLIVIDGAATDNLVELMRDNATFTSSSLLASGILFLFIGGTAIGAAIAVSSRRIYLLAITFLALPMVAGCFLAGLEPVLVKYGKVFSAAQFLLSPSREHYLPQTDLLFRFAFAYVFCTAIIAILQLRAWNIWAKKLGGHQSKLGTEKVRR